MKWVMHSRDGGRFVCQLLAASLQQVGHRAGSGLRAAIVDREAYQLHSFWGHKTNSNQLFRRRSTTPNYITRVVFLLRVYIKKTTYNLPNHTLPLIRLEVPAMRFTWLLDCLCRAYGAFPTQNAVKAQLSDPLGLTGSGAVSPKVQPKGPVECQQVFNGQTCLVNTAHNYHTHIHLSKEICLI